MGIQVLPPDINKSEFRFTVENGNIRFGLAAVKGIGQAAVEELVAARKKAGAFKSPFDLFMEHDTKVINRKAVESLIKAGAFDSLGWKRSQCYHMLDRMIDFGHDVQKAQAARQNSLFGPAGEEPPPVPQEVLDMREWDESHVLSYEMDALGLYITGHPLARHKDRLRKLVSHLIVELNSERDFDKDVRLAGIIGSFKPLKTKKDERMATFFLEDLTGKIEVVAFPDCFGRFGQYLREGQLVWIKGKYMGEEDNRRISLSQAMPLAEAFEKQAKRLVVRIFLPGLEEATLAELKTILDGYEGRCPVVFELETPRAYRLTAQSAEVQKVTPSEELIKKIEALLGENAVFVDY
jgi:DNA polymerase-3 subunit alpha